MKTINLFVDFEIRHCLPNDFVVGNINLSKKDILSESNPIFYNYMLRCPITKKYFYIGKGSKRRCLMHEWNVLHGYDDCNPHKYRKIKSIINNGSHIDIIIVACGITEHESLINEKILIKYFGRDSLTNLTDGGETNPMSDPFIKEKIRLFHVGRKRSNKTKKRISDSKKGKRLSSEHCINISKCLIDNCYAGKKIKATNLFDGQEYIFNSMLKAEKVLPIRHESMSRKLKLDNGLTIIKNYKLEYYED